MHLSGRKLAVVPAYNEVSTLGRVIAGLREHAPDFEILVIDDGSTDDTRKVAEVRVGEQPAPQPTGDQVLVRVARLLLDHVRAEDVVVRTGGEEFAVLMPGARIGEATACCHRLRTVIGGADWDDIAPDIAVTASIGVVSSSEAADMDELERLADARLYEAKRAGRDRVVS